MPPAIVYCVLCRLLVQCRLLCACLEVYYHYHLRTLPCSSTQSSPLRPRRSLARAKSRVQCASRTGPGPRTRRAGPKCEKRKTRARRRGKSNTSQDSETPRCRICREAQRVRTPYIIYTHTRSLRLNPPPSPQCVCEGCDRLARATRAWAHADALPLQPSPAPVDQAPSASRCSAPPPLVAHCWGPSVRTRSAPEMRLYMARTSVMAVSKCVVASKDSERKTLLGLGLGLGLGSGSGLGLGFREEDLVGGAVLGGLHEVGHVEEDARRAPQHLQPRGELARRRLLG